MIALANQTTGEIRVCLSCLYFTFVFTFILNSEQFSGVSCLYHPVVWVFSVILMLIAQWLLCWWLSWSGYPIWKVQ